MTEPKIRVRAALLFAAAVMVTACSSNTHSATMQPAPQAGTGTGTGSAADQQGEAAAIARAKADSARYPYTADDIEFMSSMIGHHSQAIIMSGWAESHGANAGIRTLASRIINAQQDEIRTMQGWLRDRQLPVPEAKPMTMMMNGVEQTMLMPGMLTDEQMKQLDAARGPDFDKLFLTFMMQHHKGAITMVNKLLASYGAAQDLTVMKMSSDINVDQTTEIARMQRMIAELALNPESR